MEKIKNNDDKNLHAGMLESADKAVADRGDGRISEADAKNILKHLDNDPENAGVKTWKHIVENYNLTPKAQKVLLTKVDNVELATDNVESVNDTSPPFAFDCTLKEGDIYTLYNSRDYGPTESSTPIFNEDRVTLAKGARLLNCAGNATNNDAVIQLYPGNRDYVNQWMLFANPEKPNGFWHLVNMNSGTFLDVKGGSDANKAQIVLYATGSFPECDRDSPTWKILNPNFTGYGKAPNHFSVLSNAKSQKTLTADPDC